MTNEFELFSDLYKDAHGFRPSESSIRFFDSLPYEDKVRNWEDLQEMVNARIEEDEVLEKQAVAKFRAVLDRTVAHGAADYADAVQWVLDGDPDLEMLLYEYGIESTASYIEICSWGIGYECRAMGLYKKKD